MKFKHKKDDITRSILIDAANNLKTDNKSYSILNFSYLFLKVDLKTHY